MSEQKLTMPPGSDAQAEKERTRSFLAKWGLITLFSAILLSCLYGFFQDQPIAYALATALSGPAYMILRFYFPSTSRPPSE